MSKLRLAPALLLALLALPLHAQVPGSTWERLSDAEAEAAGWSRTKLAEARQYARGIDTAAVMIVTRGKVLDQWGRVDTKYNVHSVRKSFISAMVGIEAANGRIRLDATMAELGINDRNPLSGTELQATVLDLLKARSGIYHPALYETEAMKRRRPARHSHAPNTNWYYNNWDFNALGTIYQKAIGEHFFDGLNRLIAVPIGMEDYQPADGNDVSGRDSIHNAYPFHMTARDMARFGLLFLREGNWNGVQVVPAEWVRDSVKTWSDTGRASGGYGYLWWTTIDGRHLPGIRMPNDAYAARGARGHYIQVIPSMDLVVVHRVDTDTRGTRVTATQFGELMHRILAAHKSYDPAKLRLDASEETEEPTEEL